MRFAQQETRRRRVKVEAGVQGRQQLYCSLNLYFWSIRLSTIKPEIVFFPACHTKISKRKKKVANNSAVKKGTEGDVSGSGEIHFRLRGDGRRGQLVST